MNLDEIKFPTTPWISQEEYGRISPFTYDDKNGTLPFERYEQIARTQITLVMGFVIQKVSGGTIADGYLAPQNEYDTSLYFKNAQQDILKLATAHMIEAMRTGWKPYFEMKQSFSINNGSISNSQSSFEYTDEIDQLPKIVVMLLRSLEAETYIRTNGKTTTVAGDSWVRYDNLYDTIVQLHKTYQFNGDDLEATTQAEFNQIIIDAIEAISVGAINSDIVSISDEVEEMILPVEEASQATHNKQVVQKFLETDETINQNKTDTDERLELIEATNVVQGSEIQNNTIDISANTSSISGLAQIIANSGKRFDGRLGAININNQELPLTITQVKNNYDYLTFTSPNTFVWNDTEDGNDLPNQSLVVGANFDASGAGSSVSFRVKNSLDVVVYSATETITDGGALTLLDSVNLINGETYTCFVFSSNQVRMTGGTIELLGDQVGGGGASTSSQVVDDSATEPTLGINPKLIKIGENTTAIELLEANKADKTYVDTELDKKVDKEVKNETRGSKFTNSINKTELASKIYSNENVADGVPKEVGMRVETIEFPTDSGTYRAQMALYQYGIDNVYTQYIPISTYSPTTKKYVDEAIQNAITNSFLKETILFEGSASSNSTITLSDNYKNYRLIKVICSDGSITILSNDVIQSEKYYTSSYNHIEFRSDNTIYTSITLTKVIGIGIK